MPKNNKVTELIIQEAYRIEGHSGVNHVMASIRRTFWILGGKSYIKTVLSKCMLCKKQLARQGEQIMASLPSDRISPDQPPFTNVGVDFFGPILTKIGRSYHKRYGCIFTCLASRAVHLELAGSLETDSFICALRRFISRRGKPLKIRSDNGTNLVGSEKEIKAALNELNTSTINKYLSQYMIQFEFNPPTASHMGGVWERMIRSTKRILRTLLKEQKVNEETLITILTEVEMILNDRPITQTSDDPKDLEALTPSHILLLKSNSSILF